jgi:hypothetical protein
MVDQSPEQWKVTPRVCYFQPPELQADTDKPVLRRVFVVVCFLGGAINKPD